MKDEREVGMKEMLDAIRVLVDLPERKRHELFNDGKKASLSFILHNNSPFVLIKTIRDYVEAAKEKQE